jgi:hypothetical protein
MSPDEAYRALEALAINYPRTDWPPETLKLWARLILDLDFEATQMAVLNWCSTEKWPPQSVAEIRERVVGLVTDPMPEAEAAWQEVITAVRTLGSWSEPTWSNPLVGEAVDTLRGSWQELCANLLEEELVAERAHFLKIYAGKRQTHQRHLQAVEPVRRPALETTRPPQTIPPWEAQVGRPIPE